MEKLRVCRICLVDNVRMYIVNDKDLQELYETLTDIPFVTEDSRPMLACFFCCTKLKQCCELQRKCLKAEELFAQMMNEPNTLINRGQLKCFSGFIVTPVETISIVDVNHIKSIAVKEELPAACVDDVIEPEEQHQRDDLIRENVQMVYSYVENTPALHCYESSSEDDVPLTQFKIEVEDEQEVPRKERRASDTTRVAVAKERELYIRENQKKNEESVTKVTQNTICCTSKLVPETQETLTNPTPRVIDTALDTNCRNNIKVPNLMKRIRVHTGEKRFKCDVCQSSFSRNNLLTQHIRTHTGEKPYKCDSCQLCFNRKCYLKIHMRTHTGEKPYKCEECQLSFTQKNNLTNHIRKHTGEKPYKCNECQLCFSQKSNLKKHIRKHIGAKPYKCNECQLRFGCASHLANHIRTHTGEKPFKCDECQLCFSHKCNLIGHIRTHTGERPFKCKECQLCFKLQGHLTQHIRKHTGEKPFKCKECQLCFVRKNHLTEHIRTHTGEKPYNCAECQLRFSRKSNLTKHIHSIHAGEKSYQ